MWMAQTTQLIMHLEVSFHLNCWSTSCDGKAPLGFNYCRQSGPSNQISLRLSHLMKKRIFACWTLFNQNYLSFHWIAIQALPDSKVLLHGRFDSSTIVVPENETMQSRNLHVSLSKSSLKLKTIGFPSYRKTTSRRNSLSSNSVLPSESCLSLHPFLDSSGILRDGGRQQNSRLSYASLHPVILHGKHPITKLIIRAEHLRLLHAGPTLLTLSSSAH